MIYAENNALIRKFQGETVRIDPYGENSFRVRVTRNNYFTNDSWALVEQQKAYASTILLGDEKTEVEEAVQANNSVHISGQTGSIQNGEIKAIFTGIGKLVFFNCETGEKLLEEVEANRKSCLQISSRELKNISGNVYKASLKFASDPDEKLYGMGQYQNGIFDLKGSVLELAQRNSQASVPFVYSNKNYGFLWNNPAIGKVTFAKNVTEWEACSTEQIEFWITCGNSPKQIIQQYMEATGFPPMMPEHGLGFWQCKLRYYNQEQVLTVARKYKELGIPLDVIIIDFFHWPYEGDWCFDETYWPDPKKMVEEINAMGTKVMVSVWPTVSIRSKHYREMKEMGYLIDTENGVDVNMLMIDPTSFVDTTNPDARKFFWDKIKAGYEQYGIYDYWLDVAEPEFSRYDFQNYKYFKGSALAVANEYPMQYARTLYEGLKSSGVEHPVNLIRCAWAGSQRYGALAWSGDIESSFQSFKKQIVCGLQMAMAGIPWWTTDIGGFINGNIHDVKFQELLVRWFEFGAFCPVMRLHGDRSPGTPRISNEGGGRCGSGADNEIWSFGAENQRIFTKYIKIRENMRPYVRSLMEDCSKTGAPIMRPLFFNYKDDEQVWNIKDQYMFGTDALVAPITDYQARARKVYLPKGNTFVHASTSTVYEGGQWISIPAQLDDIPVFLVQGSELEKHNPFLID